MKLRDAILAAIDGEFARQAQHSVSMPFIGQVENDEIVIDGVIEVHPLLDAIVAAVEANPAITRALAITKDYDAARDLGPSV